MAVIRKPIKSLGLTLLILVLLSSLAFAEPIDAAQFTFNVPIALYNVPPQFNQWNLSVVVYNHANQQIANSNYPFTVTGNFVQTITAKLNVYSGKNPADAYRYSVQLSCNGQNITQNNELMKLVDQTKPFQMFWGTGLLGH